MALVRKTGKLKSQIESRIDNVMHDKIKSVLEKMDVEKILHSTLGLGWEGDYFLPRNMRTLANELRDSEDNHLLCGYAPIQMRFAVFRAEEYNWSKLLQVKAETTERFPVITQPRMCFEDSEKHVAMGYSANSDYGELTPNHYFNIGLMFEKTFVGEFDESTKAYKMQHRTAPKTSSSYHSRAMQSSSWATVLSSEGLSKYKTQDVKMNIALIDQMELCQEVHAAVQRIIDRFDKTRTYIFGELWQLPSLNRMYEFFPGIRAFLTEDTIKQLERGGKKRPQYNISAPDQDVIVGATEASIK